MALTRTFLAACLASGTMGLLMSPCLTPDASARTGAGHHPGPRHHHAPVLKRQPPLQDINPDPRIVEVNLTAAETQVEYRPGVLTTVWAYNGTAPGPQIEAKVGQTLVINFSNQLPEPTTVHMHGVELPANVDGSNIAQVLVPPGTWCSSIPSETETV